ncbi:MAG: DUF4956 domain-containing protein [Oscillospiraceae bacterium]
MLSGIVQDLKDSISSAGLVDNLKPQHVFLVMLSALVCGVIIYIVYKLFYRGAVYSEGMNVLNVMVCLVTSFVIMTISTNLVLSLGMVGALSIVRFRSAIKDPLDIGFLFWSIAAGITSGAGVYILALPERLQLRWFMWRSPSSSRADSPISSSLNTHRRRTKPLRKPQANSAQSSRAKRPMPTPPS